MHSHTLIPPPALPVAAPALPVAAPALPVAAPAALSRCWTAPTSSHGVWGCPSYLTACSSPAVYVSGRRGRCALLALPLSLPSPSPPRCLILPMPPPHPSHLSISSSSAPVLSLVPCPCCATNANTNAKAWRLSPAPPPLMCLVVLPNPHCPPSPLRHPRRGGPRLCLLPVPGAPTARLHCPVPPPVHGGARHEGGLRCTGGHEAVWAVWAVWWCDDCRM